MARKTAPPPPVDVTPVRNHLWRAFDTEYRILVKPLWPGHYRANLHDRKDNRIRHSFFVRETPEGFACEPPLVDEVH